MMLLLVGALAVFPDCPDQPEGCTGTAIARAHAAMQRARNIDLDRPWDDVREAILDACGLQNLAATSHCFNDFNHVDCCAMGASSTHRTNERSRVTGMHPVNQLGPHILTASIAERGAGGSWCTCHLSSPRDVCHQQFGARTAFKLIWCDGTRVAMLVDDYGNVLASGKPTGGSEEVPTYGGSRAREEAWRVLSGSANSSWAAMWRGACARGAGDDGELGPGAWDGSVAEGQQGDGDVYGGESQHDEL